MFTGWTKASAIVVNRMALLTRQLGISLLARQAHDFSPISSSPNRAFNILLVEVAAASVVYLGTFPAPGEAIQVLHAEVASGPYHRAPHNAQGRPPQRVARVSPR